MTDTKPTTGKTDEFYAVARSIPNKDWPAFARGESYLGLPQSKIDDIQHDYHSNHEEQKFQMLLRWEQREGRNATVENLKRLRDNFLGRLPVQPPPQPLPVASSSPQLSSSNASIPPPPEDRNFPFRLFLMELGSELQDHQFVSLKTMCGINSSEYSAIETAAQCLTFLDDRNYLGNNLQEKLQKLGVMMRGINRTDLHERIELKARTFVSRPTSAPYQRTGASENQPHLQTSLSYPSSSHSITSHRGMPNPPNPISPHPNPAALQSTPHTPVYHGPLQASPPYPANHPGPVHSHRFDSSNFQGATSSRNPASPSFYHSSSQPSAPLPSSSRVNPQTSSLNQMERNLSEVDSSSPLFITSSNRGRSNLAVNCGNVESDQSDTQRDSQQAANVEERFFMEETVPNTNVVCTPSEPRLDHICTYNGTDVQVKPCTQAHFNELCTRDDVYHVSAKPKGYVLILSNVNFPNWGSEYSRVGGKKDCELMQKLFTGLGLVTIVFEDSTRDMMWKRLETFSKDTRHANANMCVVIIMSHGQHITGEGDAIFGTDGRYILADDVVKLFDNVKCPLLRKKPKMFFFQFCRGVVADPGVRHDTDQTFAPYPSGNLPSISESLNQLQVSTDETDSIEHLPRRSDILVAFATQEGNLAFRSWFTNALTNVFSKDAHDSHVIDMLTKIKRGIAQKVSHNPENPLTHRCKEMADVRDILLKKIYFFPGFP